MERLKVDWQIGFKAALSGRALALLLAPLVSALLTVLRAALLAQTRRLPASFRAKVCNLRRVKCFKRRPLLVVLFGQLKTVWRGFRLSETSSSPRVGGGLKRLTPLR